MADNGEEIKQEVAEQQPEEEPKETSLGEDPECTETTDNTNEQINTEPEAELKVEATAELTETNESPENGDTKAEPAPENGDGDATEKTETEEAATDGEGNLINATEDNDLKMFVGGLSWDTEVFGLKDYFSQFGEVKDCTIKKDSKTERSRGFGFVLFATEEAVQKVLNTPHHELDGRKIDPKRAQAQRLDGKLFAGGLNPDTDDEVIKEYFEQYGEVEVFERPKDKQTNRARGFCFVTFKKDGVLALAIKERQQEIDGKQIEVKEAQQQDRNRNRGMGRGWPGQGYGGGGGFGYAGYPGGYESYGSFGGYGQGGGYGGYGNYGGYNPGYGGGPQQQQGGAGKAPRRGMGGYSYKPY